MKKAFPGILLIILGVFSVAAQNSGGEKGGAPSNNTRTSNSLDLPANWQTYNIGLKKTFKMAMPQKPEIESENLNGDGLKMKATYYIASSDEIFTAVADIYDLPLNAADLSEKGRTDLFNKVREGFTNGVTSEMKKRGIKAEVKFYSKKSVNLQGISGYEQDLSIGTIKGRTRMLSTKDHIFIFITLLLDDSKENLMNVFLDSFESVGSN